MTTTFSLNTISYAVNPQGIGETETGSLTAQEAVERWPHLARYILDSTFRYLRLRLGETVIEITLTDHGPRAAAHPHTRGADELLRRAGITFQEIVNRIARIWPPIVESYIQPFMTWPDYGDLCHTAAQLEQVTNNLEGIDDG